MVGGCCVCSDERGWDENPLVYCDGDGCNVAVHQGNQLNIQHHLNGLLTKTLFVHRSMLWNRIRADRAVVLQKM